MFERFYAHCALAGSCSAVPALSPDAAFFQGAAYYPAGRPQDWTFYRLFQLRRLQASASEAALLALRGDARSRSASEVYRWYHNELLLSERQEGKMIQSLLGVEERVSPNEGEADSLFSIHHRTLEWNQKKEIGVMVFNSFPTAAREVMRVLVATPDICVYNALKMYVRQQVTPLLPDLWELMWPSRLAAYSYSTFILHYCEDQERDKGAAHAVQGHYLDGDIFRLEFDDTGRFTALTSRPDRLRFLIDFDLVLLTPDAAHPGRYLPHGLPPTDPRFVTPVGAARRAERSWCGACCRAPSASPSPRSAGRCRTS